MRLLILPILFLLSGCLSLEGLTSTGASTVGAVVGTTLGGPGAGLAAGAVAGVATDALVNPEQNPANFAGEDGELNFWELLAYAWYNFTQHIIVIGIMAGVLWVATGYLGIRMKRPEEKAAEQQMKTLIDKIGQMRE